MSYHGVEYTSRRNGWRPYPAEDSAFTYVAAWRSRSPPGSISLNIWRSIRPWSFSTPPGARVGNMDPKKTERMLALHPILHINALEAEAMSQKTSYEDAAAYLHSITGNTVIVTLGEKGAYCIEKDGTSYLIPSIPADHVEDTIGAGDAHAGAIIGCLTNGLSLRDSIAYANQVSRIVVSVKALPFRRSSFRRSQSPKAPARLPHGPGADKTATGCPHTLQTVP